MSKGIYFILHSALIAAMAVTAVAVCFSGREETNPEPTTTTETTAFVAMEPEAEDIQEIDTFETEAEDTAAPEIKDIPLGEFKLTAYCKCAKCCGEWADGYTATMTVATADRTIAVDPKVIPYGSEVLINGKTYIAEDCGGAIKGKRIDVYHNTHAEALEFGIQYADVTILN